MENKNINNVNFNQFYDELGNLKDEQNFEVIVYYKNTNNEWIENERRESCANYFIVDNKLYYRGNKALLSMNMDFDSVDCGACYQIGKFFENNHKIIGNQILFVCKSELGGILKLHKQLYSDETCFYTLEDGRGDWNVNYGSNNLQDLIKQMQLEINIEQEKSQKDCIKNNPKIKVMYDELKRWKQEVINNLQLCLD